MRYILVFIAFFYFCKLNAQEDLGTVDVIGTSPLPGILIDRKDVPHTSQKITETQIQENLTKTITDLMNENFSGISVKDLQTFLLGLSTLSINTNQIQQKFLLKVTLLAQKVKQYFKLLKTVVYLNIDYRCHPLCCMIQLCQVLLRSMHQVKETQTNN